MEAGHPLKRLCASKTTSNALRLAGTLALPADPFVKWRGAGTKSKIGLS